MRLAVVVALLAVARASAAAPAVLVAVEVEAPSTVRLELTAPVAPVARRLPAGGGLPSRVYLDLPQTALGALPNLVAGSGDLLRVRTAQYDPGTVRVVLDLREPRPFTIRQAQNSILVELAPRLAPRVSPVEPPPAAPPIEVEPAPALQAVEAPTDPVPADGPPPPAAVRTNPAPRAAREVPPSAAVALTEVAPLTVTGPSPRHAHEAQPTLAQALVSDDPRPAPTDAEALAVVDSMPAPPEIAPEAPMVVAAAGQRADLADLEPPPPSPDAPEPPPAVAAVPTPPPPDAVPEVPVVLADDATAVEAAPTPPAPTNAPPPAVAAVTPPPPAVDPPATPPVPRAPVLRGALPVIVLDAGHGGRDPGAEGVGGVLEKDVVLELARLLAERLPAHLPVAVAMTRSDDSFVSIDRRLSVPEGATLFLSLHANACSDPSARGLEIFYGGGAVRQASTAGTNVPAILLGRCIDEALRRVGPVRGSPRPGSFRVLTQNPVPSALVEIGYLTHPAEAEQARDARYQALLADALVQGIGAFLRVSATPPL